MNFYLSDFNNEVRERIIKDYGNTKEDEPIAALINFDENENCPKIAGSFENIQKLIPILSDMGYDDFNLYYEDYDIWVLKWHNSKFDGLSWMLVE